MSDQSGQVLLTIPPNPEYLVLTRLVLTALARANPQIDAETLADLKLATTEACTNSIRHASCDPATNTITVSYELDANRLTINVVDRGRAAAPLKPRKLHPVDDPAEDGMGLQIIEALMDHHELAPDPSGLGNRLTLTKYLRARVGS